ncbi:MAG TPA: hypothetical protein VMT30_06470 [Candidatus Saccharimonadia bacterium]|nr:hypothetical protein [Candidatus Saccharimonadia bacterium]
MTKSKRTRRHHQRVFRRRLLIVGAFIVGLLLLPNLGARAATLTSASVGISDPRPSAISASYTFTASSVTTGAPGTIKCIKMLYSDTAAGSTVPAGMSTNGGGVTFDTAGSNYVPTPASWTLNKPANGTLTLTNATGETPASAAARKIIINGITNSSAADTKFWLKFNTYNNTDCASSPVDNTTVLFILTNASTLSLTVDDTLSFTVNAVGAAAACDGATTTAASTATTIPFGTVTAASNGVVCQDLQAATNATGGYTIYARYTAQPTNSLAQTIASHTGTNPAPTAFSAAGTEAYGYTTGDATLGTGTANRFTSPTQEWAGLTTTNAELAYEPAGVTASTYRIGHQVGVSSTTRPGTYTTTVIYTCTPTY